MMRETEIVWEVDPLEFDYVREAYVDHPRRRGPIRWPCGRRVGYSETERPGVRRVFWVAAHDRCNAPDGVYRALAPVEAVDPRTVAPNVAGELTERAWGGPLSRAGRCGAQSSGTRPLRSAA